MCFLFVDKGYTGTFSNHKHNLCLCLEEAFTRSHSPVAGYSQRLPVLRFIILHSIISWKPHNSSQKWVFFFASEEIKFMEPSWPIYVEMKELELELSFFTLRLVFIPASIPHLALWRSFYRIKSEAKTKPQTELFWALLLPRSMEHWCEMRAVNKDASTYSYLDTYHLILGLKSPTSEIKLGTPICYCTTSGALVARGMGEWHSVSTSKPWRNLSSVITNSHNCIKPGGLQACSLLVEIFVCMM